jgi:hypothetical protein
MEQPSEPQVGAEAPTITSCTDYAPSHRGVLEGKASAGLTLRGRDRRSAGQPVIGRNPEPAESNSYIHTGSYSLNNVHCMMTTAWV